MARNVKSRAGSHLTLILDGEEWVEYSWVKSHLDGTSETPKDNRLWTSTPTRIAGGFASRYCPHRDDQGKTTPSHIIDSDTDHAQTIWSPKTVNADSIYNRHRHQASKLQNLASKQQLSSSTG